MVARRSGRIVTNASSSGLAPEPYISAYGVSKCAAVRWSETLAAETKELGISVFAIHPGFVRTAMTEEGGCSADAERWLGGRIRKGLEAGYDIPPERAGQLVVLLASGRADALSGCFISVHADVAQMLSRAEEIQEGELCRLRLRT
jgi:3-oxoacyl-[acyl-carrier protein] reductase